jgi:transglutaminase-like putative cysteine protease
MKIRLGYEIKIYHPQYTPMVAMLSIHPSRIPDLMTPDQMLTTPATNLVPYQDVFGNLATRLIAPPGEITLTADATIFDSGLPDQYDLNAIQHEVSDLPDECMQFLLASRYCETDEMMDIAWGNFNHVLGGWKRVQAICDFAHNQITFGYQHARRTRTAYQGYQERLGVCRDFAHLAVTLCRCMNIPARYCTGYLGDIGVPKDPAPMDFSAWFEAYIGGQWVTFDARHNTPRIGRVVIARGRDAADVAITTHFGPSVLNGFRVWTDEVDA